MLFSTLKAGGWEITSVGFFVAGFRQTLKRPARAIKPAKGVPRRFSRSHITIYPDQKPGGGRHLWRSYEGGRTCGRPTMIFFGHSRPYSASTRRRGGCGGQNWQQASRRPEAI